MSDHRPASSIPAGLLCPLPVIRTQDALSNELHTAQRHYSIVRATDPGDSGRTSPHGAMCTAIDLISASRYLIDGQPLSIRNPGRARVMHTRASRCVSVDGALLFVHFLAAIVDSPPGPY